MRFPPRTTAERGWLALSAFALSLGGTACGSGEAASEEPVAPKHVVIVVIDTLRADALGCYGAEGLVDAEGQRSSPTPHIDALALRGTRFQAVESSSSWTVSSAVSYLSGLNPLVHGVNSKKIEGIPEDVPLLPEVLDDAGFVSAAYVCNPMLGPKLGFDRGFDTFERMKFGPAAPAVDKALAWAEAAVASDPDAPLLLYVHLFDPHWPYEPAGPEAERFPLPESPLTMEEQVATSMAMHTGSVEAAQRLMDWMPWARDAYSACVSTSDRETGRLLDGLDQLGILDSALTIVTSDHGEEFGEHGTIGHAKQLYAESLRVPLIIAGPGLPQGATATEPCELRHLAATVLAQVGLYGKGGLRGANLLDGPSRAAAAAEEHIAAVELGLVPVESGGFRQVGRLVSLRRGDQRAIASFEDRFDDGSGWVSNLDESGYSSSRRRAEAIAGDPHFRSLREHCATARLGTLLRDEELEKRREELRALGYFGASEAEEER